MERSVGLKPIWVSRFLDSILTREMPVQFLFKIAEAVTQCLFFFGSD